MPIISSEVISVPLIKPRLGQGRAGIKWKIKLPLSLPPNKSIIYLTEKSISQQPQNLAQPKITLNVPPPESSQIHYKFIPVPDYVIPKMRSGDDSHSRMVKRKTIQNIKREIPTYPDPIYRPPPKPTEISLPEIPRKLRDLDMDINTDFKENSPYQEGVILKMYQNPGRSYFQEQPELDHLISTGKLVQKFLPKQADIDKILKILQRKALKGTHLPVTVKEIQVGYLISPYFWRFIFVSSAE